MHNTFMAEIKAVQAWAPMTQLMRRPACFEKEEAFRPSCLNMGVASLNSVVGTLGVPRGIWSHLTHERAGKAATRDAEVGAVRRWPGRCSGCFLLT